MDELELIDKIKTSVDGYYIPESSDNSDEFVNFFFLGEHNGKSVLFDAAIYTLRMHHNGEMYAIAEEEAREQFKNFDLLKEELDNEEDEGKLSEAALDLEEFLAEAIFELEDEGEVKVREFVEIDESADIGFGLDVSLHVEAIDENLVKQFIIDYNSNTLDLNPTLFSFQDEEE